MRLFHVVQAVLILFAGLQQIGPLISAPGSGQSLQGQVTVSGSADGEGFSYAELAFAYAADPTDTWFLIQTIMQPMIGGSLTLWDTSVLTDGDYRLRLRLYLLDGSYQDFIVEDLHLSNGAPPPTGTPPVTRTAPASTPLPLPSLETGASSEVPPTEPPPTVMADQRPAPFTPPVNPAAITTRSVFSFLGRGALLSLILFVVLGLLLRLRRS